MRVSEVVIILAEFLCLLALIIGAAMIYGPAAYIVGGLGGIVYAEALAAKDENARRRKAERPTPRIVRES